MKKNISFLVSLALIFFLVSPVSAGERYSEDDEWIIEAEKFIFDTVYFDEDYELSKSSAIYVGTQIPTYIADNHLQARVWDANVRYYPVLSGFEVIGLLGVYEEENQFVFSYSEECAKLISDTLNKSKRIALVWDNKLLKVVTPSDNNVYLKTATNDESFMEFADPYETRIDLAMEYTNTARFSYPSSYSLSVATKLQSKNWDCWAATTACIGQYYTGLNYSSTYVANRMNINTTANMNVVKNALGYIYNYASTYPGNQPSYADICYSIYNLKKPLATGLINPNYSIGHMVVIYGYSSGSYYSGIIIMDPASGKTTISLSNTSVPMSLILAGSTYYIYEYLY